MIDSSEMMSAMLSRIASRSLSRWRCRSPALRSERSASEEEYGRKTAIIDPVLRGQATA
jgi:hypothetical protein